MKCRICLNERTLNYNVSEMMYKTGESFKYFKCLSCGCFQIEEIPENIAIHYSNDYYSYSKYDESKFNGLYGAFKSLKYHWSFNHKGIVNKLFHFLFPEPRFELMNKLLLNKESHILDVGTGNGEYLYPLSQLGYKNTLGIDPYLQQSIEYGNGLKIKNIGIFDVEAGWDLITYNHVLEHLADPQKELIRISEILNSGGTCIVTIPTIDSYAWYKYRTYWYQIDAPRHFFIFSIESMRILANNAGLKIKSIHYDSSYTQFFYSELNRDGIAFRDRPKIKGFKKIAWKFKKIKFNILANKLNKRSLGDQLAVVLIKNSESA